MRCPKCTERNSVASRKCEFCGERFKRKPLPLSLKLAAAGVLVAVTASIGASYVVPKFVDPEQNLARVAKELAAGPRSVEDATRSKIEFSNAVRDYLKDNGTGKTSELTAGLQKLLPANTYEVHIAELPRGIRIVEIDTVLQACGYLVMKTASGSKVFDLPGFEVFDDARILNDTAGPVLALIGHSGGPPPHRPQVKMYALLPDYLNDETEKLVPPITGDGRAKFAANNQDILLELTPNAKGKPHTSAETAWLMLHWKDAHYTADTSSKTAKAARKLIEAPGLAVAPMTVATTAAAPPASKAQAVVETAATVASTSGGSSAERAVSVASPVLANAIANARSAARGGGKNAKIVVRGLTDTPPTQALMNQLPGVAEATGHERRSEATVATNSGADSVKGTDASASSAATDSKTTDKKKVASAASTSSTHDSPAHADSSSSHSYGTVNCAGASFRAKPKTGAAVISGLSHGTQVRIAGREGDWYHIRYHGQDGYIYARLIDVVSKVSGSAPEAVAASGTGHKHRHHGNSTVLVADVTAHASHNDSSANSSDKHSSKHHHKHSSHASSAPVIEAPMVP
jgi:Bacterial SH3 domain